MSVEIYVSALTTVSIDSSNEPVQLRNKLITALMLTNSLAFFTTKLRN